MTADIRKIRSHDLETPGARDAEREPAVLGCLALPFNDNAREANAREDGARGSRAPIESETPTGDDHPAAPPATLVGEGPRTRRGGPLVTRWIGFAAHRRANQARTNRMRDLASGRSGR
ncbi:hypothetical protein [Methylobacterium sp. J-068]|uniref:hypothetical protein n=1 Tax=Methylobacterium sp. J-068 TaxID=2836649 RepID=UPI001FB92C80|nr:hypothetical protein [Methylobacterium sp. J-068]MCJ2034161.1 hypothetical protein [Methylobacterium sp. J-068]